MDSRASGINARLEKLERENRRMKKVGIVAIVFASVLFISGQATTNKVVEPNEFQVVDQIMAAALARCYSVTADGVKTITFMPPTNEEVAEVKTLGPKAIAPLARYLDLKQKNGLTQLFAVRFLMAIGGTSTLAPLKRAFAQDQWEVVRDVALSAIFAASPSEAKPYVEAALGDKSQVVRQHAQHLWSLYQGQIK